MITIRCQECGRVGEHQDFLMGQRVKCKGCPAWILVVPTPVSETRNNDATPALAQAVPTDAKVVPAETPSSAPKSVKRVDLSVWSDKPPEPVSISPSSRRYRLAARFMDVALLVMVDVIGKVLLSSENSWVFLFPTTFYFYNLYLLSTQGQTLGKKLIGIRVVSFPQCQPVGFVQAVLLREWMFPLLILGTLLNGMFGGILGLRDSVVMVFSGGLPLFIVVDSLFICSQEKRCLHDYIATTVVIDTDETGALGSLFR